MSNKIIYHNFKNGLKAKITIIEKVIEGKTFYFANLANIELEEYMRLSDLQKESYIGVLITNGKQKPVYYSDEDRLIADLIEKYDDEYLETEI